MKSSKGQILFWKQRACRYLHPMKTLALGTLLFVSTTCFGQLPEVILKDSILIEITKKVLDSLHKSSQETVKVINYSISNLNEYYIEKDAREEKFGGQVMKIERFTDFNLVVGLPTDPKVFEYAKPDCYFSYEGVVFFVYLGGSSLFKYTKKEKARLVKLISPLRSSFSNSPRYFCLEVKNKKFRFLPTVTPSEAGYFPIW